MMTMRKRLKTTTPTDPTSKNLAKEPIAMKNQAVTMKNLKQRMTTWPENMNVDCRVGGKASVLSIVGEVKKSELDRTSSPEVIRCV
jgi:hypothetical protein